MKTMDSKCRGELGIVAGLGVVALAFFAMGNFTQTANPLDPGPALFPRMISMILLIMCGGQFAVTIRKQAVPKKASKDEKTEEENSVIKYVIGSVIFTAAYIFFFTKITYVITTPLFLFALLYLLGVRTWKPLVFVPVGYTVISYFLYGTVLMVPLP